MNWAGRTDVPWWGEMIRHALWISYGRKVLVWSLWKTSLSDYFQHSSWTDSASTSFPYPSCTDPNLVPLEWEKASYSLASYKSRPFAVFDSKGFHQCPCKHWACAGLQLPGTRWRQSLTHPAHWPAIHIWFLILSVTKKCHLGLWSHAQTYGILHHLLQWVSSPHVPRQQCPTST